MQPSKFGQPAAELEVLPFDAPKEGRVISNYLVPYEVASKGGTRYSGRFAVYVFEAAGRRSYLVKEPYIDPAVRAGVASAVNSLTTWLAPSPVVELDPIGYLTAEMERAGLLSGLSQEDLHAATHYLVRDILGYWVLDPLVRDPDIEDISCEGLGRRVKVWHRRFSSAGWLESNVVFREQESLDSMVSRLVHRCGRTISNYSPIVDAVLPEGFRLAATWGREVTSFGSSFTIRKQRAEPFTLSELIKAGTMTTSIAAYLWTMLDLKGFVVISGVTASGKTTVLNALATVLNPAWKIVSIEDTREIGLPHSGWKPLHTRNPQAPDGITLFDLVKLSLRERPDFVILGEARGEEVQALFQTAAAGSGCATTFHSPNVESMAARLTQPPLSVSPSILSLIDSVVFMVRSPDGTSRTVSRVVEMTDPPVTLFSSEGGAVEGSADQSIKLAARAVGFGVSERRLVHELERRREFLEKMVGLGVTEYPALARELRRFYSVSAFTA
jgi:archaeal flagellar protein FlaI